jgi:cobaltochelatase CobS
MNALITNINTNTELDLELMETVDASLLFSCFEGGEFYVARRVNRGPDCLTSNPDYIPEANTLRKVLAWWFSPRKIALGLEGETGTGKTELLMYLADKLNEPLYIQSINGFLTPAGLEGDKSLVTGELGVITENNYSPAAKGYSKGGLILLDEIDKANEELSSSLHLMLEGKPWTLNTFKEVITQHSNCRITCTANTLGQGGHERYLSSQRLDAAVRARIGWLHQEFPTPARELEILEKKFSKLPGSILRRFVQTANDFRDALLGTDRKGIEDPLNCVFSPRTITTWAYYAMVFGRELPLRESLEFAFFGSVDPEDKSTVESILQRRWGGDLDVAFGDLIGKK